MKGYSKVSSCLNHTVDPFLDDNLVGIAGLIALLSSNGDGCSFGMKIFGGELPKTSSVFTEAPES